MAADRPVPPLATRKSGGRYGFVNGPRPGTQADRQLSKSANSHSRPISDVAILQSGRSTSRQKTGPSLRPIIVPAARRLPLVSIRAPWTDSMSARVLKNPTPFLCWTFTNYHLPVCAGAHPIDVVQGKSVLHRLWQNPDETKPEFNITQRWRDSKSSSHTDILRKVVPRATTNYTRSTP